MIRYSDKIGLSNFFYVGKQLVAWGTHPGWTILSVSNYVALRADGAAIRLT